MTSENTKLKKLQIHNIYNIARALNIKDNLLVDLVLNSLDTKNLSIVHNALINQVELTVKKEVK